MTVHLQGCPLVKLSTGLPFLAAAVAILLAATTVTAEPYHADRTVEVVVDSRATGGFGAILGGIEPDPAVQELVFAAVLKKKQRVSINALGSIILATENPLNSTVGADGITSPRNPGIIYFPLEEAFVDLSGGVLPGPLVENVGALMGAFIPFNQKEHSGILPRNNDPSPAPGIPPFLIPNPPVVGDIPADALFLIGSGPFDFVAQEKGVLFLGINDAYTPNNAGAFAVSIVISRHDNQGD